MKFHECHCDDVVVGAPWLREIPQPAAIDPARSKVLFMCDACGGYGVVSVDHVGRATIVPPTGSNLKTWFAEWLESTAGSSKQDIDSISNAIGSAYEKNISAGCRTCLNSAPDKDIKNLIEVAKGDYESLFQCPDCGTYRWRMFETHGFAELPVWGAVTREAIGRFSSFVSSENLKNGRSEEETIEWIFQHSV